MQPQVLITVGYITGIIWGLYLKISIVPILFLCLGVGILLNKKGIFTLNRYYIIAIIFALISNLQVNFQESKFNNLYQNLSEIKVIRSNQK